MHLIKGVRGPSSVKSGNLVKAVLFCYSAKKQKFSLNVGVKDLNIVLSLNTSQMKLVVFASRVDEDEAAH